MPTTNVVVSGRRGPLRMSKAFTYEYEDVVAELLDARIVSPATPASAPLRQAWRAARAGRLLLGRRELADQPSIGLLVAVGQAPSDLVAGFAAVDAVDRAAVAVARIEELYPGDLPLRADVRAYLRRFDHVFLGAEQACAPLEAELGVPVTHLPPAVDAVAFGRGALASPRPIDVYAMGRRHAPYHDAMLARAERSGELYLYDTFTGNPLIKDHRAHRANLRGLVRRTHAFVVNLARMDEPGRTGGEEVGFRYFEGAAGGAVLVGSRPAGPSFERLFPWDDAVVELVRDGSDVDEVLDGLAADPARVARIRRDNVHGVLDAHDIAHRVAQVLETVELPHTPPLEERMQRLRHLATQDA